MCIGRVLPTPNIVYGDSESSTMVPKDGVWNMRGMKFIKAKAKSNEFIWINY